MNGHVAVQPVFPSFKSKPTHTPPSQGYSPTSNSHARQNAGASTSTVPPALGSDCLLTNTTCRTKIPLSFPLLDSFPHIYTSPRSASSLGVSTSLSTDTKVALRIKNLQSIVNRAVGVDEREALGNSLGEIAEAYEEGWDSGSDSDDD